MEEKLCGFFHSPSIVNMCAGEPKSQGIYD